MTEETARTLHVEVGSVIHLSAHRDLTVRVTGIVTPEDADSPYWSVDSLLRAPSLRRVPGPMGASNPPTGSAVCWSPPRRRPRCWARPPRSATGT